MAISAGGIDALAYAGHSFQISTVTTAVACGLPESLIKPWAEWAHLATEWAYLAI